jgi:hypothetical protein
MQYTCGAARFDSEFFLWKAETRKKKSATA